MDDRRGNAKLPGDLSNGMPVVLEPLSKLQVERGALSPEGDARALQAVQTGSNTIPDPDALLFRHPSEDGKKELTCRTKVGVQEGFLHADDGDALPLEVEHRLGMIDCLGEFHTDFVRTHRHKNNPDSVPYQDDWIFASKKLKPVSCAPLDTEEAWKLSDHCPVVAEFEIAR